MNCEKTAAAAAAEEASGLAAANPLLGLGNRYGLWTGWCIEEAETFRLAAAAANAIELSHGCIMNA